MADAFRDNLNFFILNLLKKVGNNVELDQIQIEYDKIIDEFTKNNFIPKEEIDKIIESELGPSEKEINNLKRDKLDLIKKIDMLESQIKIVNMQKEGMKEKVEILEKSLLKDANEKEEKEKLKNELSSIKKDYEILEKKYISINEEIDIYKKNVKKNFNMEKIIKQLTEENEKLCQKIKKFDSDNDYKVKYENLELMINEYKIEKNNYINQIKLLNEKNNELENNINQYKENILLFENDNKIKVYQIEQKNKEITNLNNNLVELNNKCKESEYNFKQNKIILDNQNKEIKKEFEKLYKNYENLKKENEEINTKLKKYENYTNYAKTLKENYSKKDFSMLETMSRRVEETENLNINLKETIQNIQNDHNNLLELNNQYKSIILYYMNLLGEIKDYTNDSFINVNDPKYKEIEQMKLSPDILLSIIFKTKKENIDLIQNFQEITIEYNQKLRDDAKASSNNK